MATFHETETGTIWIRASDEDMAPWHGIPIPRLGELNTWCGLTFRTDDVQWTPGELPPRDDRCGDCDGKETDGRLHDHVEELLRAGG